MPEDQNSHLSDLIRRRSNLNQALRDRLDASDIIAKADVKDLKSTLNELKGVIEDIFDIRIDGIRERGLESAKRVDGTIQRDAEEGRDIADTDFCLDLSLHNRTTYRDRISIVFVFRMSEIRPNLSDEDYHGVVAHFRPEKGYGRSGLAFNRAVLLDAPTDSPSPDQRNLFSALMKAVCATFTDFKVPDLEAGEYFQVAVNTLYQTKLERVRRDLLTLEKAKEIVLKEQKEIACE